MNASSPIVIILVAAIIAIIPSFLFLSQNSQTLIALQGLSSGVDELLKQRRGLEVKIEELTKQQEGLETSIGELLKQQQGLSTQQGQPQQQLLPQSAGKDSAQVLECLKKKTAPQTTTCWNELRRKNWLETINAWEKLPEDQLIKFRTTPNWDPFDVITPTYECDANHVQRIGESGDGGKWVCTEDYMRQKDCIVFSLGSNGQFDFEQSMQKLSNGVCKIHTFDCTGTWSDPSTTYHPWCLGAKDDVDAQGRIYKTFTTIIKELNIDHVSYLKMDIEGYEWAVFDELLKKGTPLRTLPRQISFELHILGASPTGPNFGLSIIKLAKELDAAGYRVAMQERNLRAKNCNEYVLIRDDSVQ